MTKINKRTALTLAMAAALAPMVPRQSDGAGVTDNYDLLTFGDDSHLKMVLLKNDQPQLWGDSACIFTAQNVDDFLVTVHAYHAKIDAEKYGDSRDDMADLDYPTSVGWWLNTTMEGDLFLNDRTCIGPFATRDDVVKEALKTLRWYHTNEGDLA